MSLQFPSKAAKVLDEGGNGTFSAFWLSWLQQVQALVSGLVGSVGGLNGLIAAQSANKFYAGPPTGAAANPTFRSIVAADLPGVTATITTAKLTGGGVNGSMTFTNGILTAQTPAT